jgi:Na+/phosphate symporter
MTDDELIRALRLQSEHVPAFTIFDKAADRIEELLKQIETVLIREAETQARHDSKMDALEDKLADAVATLRGAVNICQRAINGYAAKMHSSKNKAEGRDWQTMLFAAQDIKHDIIQSLS